MSEANLGTKFEAGKTPPRRPQPRTDGTMNLLEERASTHGTFRDVARTAQAIKAEIRLSKNLSLAQAEALDLVATKLARIINGNANAVEHWVDLEGYARLVRLELETEV